MAKTHSSLTGADLHDNKGIGVETSANFMTISQSTNILSASAESTASFGRFEGSGDSHFSGSVSFGGNMTFGDADTDSVSITADLTSNLIPNADATYDLGSSSKGWNDLHLGSGGVINLDGGDVTLTHSANLVSIAGGNTRVIRLEIDSASDYIDVDTDLKIIAAADVVVDPGGGELKVDGNVVPNSDSADSLGASGTAWLKLWVDAIDLNGQGSISMGGTGRIDLDADDDTSIRASADDVITFEAGGADEMSLSATSLYPATDDGLALGSANQNWADLFIADAGVINLGDDQDVTLTHVENTGILLNSTRKIQFGDSGTFIHQSGDGVLTIESDTTVDINGAVAFDGALTGITNITLNGTLSDGNYTFDTSGNVTGLGTIGSGNITSTGTIQGTVITATTGFAPDAQDGAYLGTSALQFSDLFLADESVIALGNDGDVTLTHVEDTGVLLNSDNKIQFGDSGTFIHQSANGVLTITSDTTVDINGAVVFDGNVSGVGTLGCGAITSTGNLAVTGTITGDTSLTLDSTTWTTAELGVLDGVTAGTAAASKALVLDGSKNIATIGTIGCGAITTSGNLAVTGTITGDTSLTLDTTTLTTAELGVLDSVTAGTAAASKALVLDASKDIGTIRNLTIDGTLSDGNYTFDTSGNVTGLGTVGCGAITSTGNSSFAGGVTVGGNLTVNGSTVTVDATTLNVADKNITIASGSTTSANMDGAGLNFGLDAVVSQLAYRHSDTTLTSSVDLGAPQFHSSIATGTAPLTVQSTTVVANLNAATVAGKTMAIPGAIGGTTAAAGTFTNLTVTTDVNIDDSSGDGAMDGVIIGAATAASATFTTVNATTFDATTDFTIDGLVLTADTITNDAALTVVSTGLTLNASLDIALSADGGNVTMDDGSTTIFDFNTDDPELKIMDDAQVANYASIAVGANGATTLSTVDADAAIAHLTLDADGDINLDPVAGGKIVLDGTINVDAGVLTGATSITSTELFATSASITYITASKLEVDATSLTIGGTVLTKTIADNIQTAKLSGTNTGDQDLWDVVAGDTGTTTSNSATDTLTIAGGTGITTTVSGDTLTVTSAVTAGDGLTLNTADIDIDASQTTLTSILNTSLVVGRDSDNDIDFATDNNIRFRAGGEDQLTLTDGFLTPSSNAIVDLGTDALEFKDGWFDGTVTSDAFAGPLTGEVTGNASTATALASARTIAMTGDVVWSSGNFDGSGNVTAAATIQATSVDNSMLAGSIANAKLSNSSLTYTAGTGLTGGGAVSLGSSATLNVIGGDGITVQADQVDVTAAQTTITSIINNGLSIGGYSSHQLIDFSADDMIKVSVNNVDEFRFVAGGTFHANSDVVAYSSTVASDMNLKENITDMKYGLDTIMQLRGVEYDWKREDMGHDLGVLAQEVEKVIPEIVKEYDGLQGREKFKAVDYNKLVPVLIESIKELKSQIDELKLIKN